MTLILIKLDRRITHGLFDKSALLALAYPHAVHLGKYPICSALKLLLWQFFGGFRGFFNRKFPLCGRQYFTHLVYQLGFVLLDAAFPYKGVLVCYGFNLGAVYVLHVKGNKTLAVKQFYNLGKHTLKATAGKPFASETVDCTEIGPVHAAEPHEMDILVQ